MQYHSEVRTAMHSIGTGDKPVVLFIRDGSAAMRLGGAALRWAAIETALDQCATTTKFQVRCPDEADCTHDPAGNGSDDGKPFFHNAYCSIAAGELRQVAERVQPDIVVASGLEMWRYLSMAKEVTGAVAVLDVHNADSVLADEVGAAMRDHPHGGLFHIDDGAAIRAIESAALKWVDHLWTCTTLDAERLSAMHDYPMEMMTVIVNTVRSPAVRPLHSGVDQAFYVGRFSWFPNYLVAEFLIEQVAPLLARSAEPVPMILAGFDPPAPLLERALPPAVQLLATPVTIDHLWSNSVLAAPITLGGGSHLKVIEAFAAGCPVVSTAKGFEGIDAAEEGVHYLRAETAAEMTEAIGRLRSDHVLRENLTKAAFDVVNEYYTPGCLVPVMADCLQRLRAAAR
jgi:glycosyltransferase involved in cell wall biosynthesis